MVLHDQIRVEEKWPRNSRRIGLSRASWNKHFSFQGLSPKLKAAVKWLLANNRFYAEFCSVLHLDNINIVTPLCVLFASYVASFFHSQCHHRFHRLLQEALVTGSALNISSYDST